MAKFCKFFTHTKKCRHLKIVQNYLPLSIKKIKPPTGLESLNDIELGYADKRSAKCRRFVKFRLFDCQFFIILTFKLVFSQMVAQKSYIMKLFKFFQNFEWFSSYSLNCLGLKVAKCRLFLFFFVGKCWHSPPKHKGIT